MSIYNDFYGFTEEPFNITPKFDCGAMRRVYQYSKGIPQLINAVCDKTFLCGFVMGTESRTCCHARRAIYELEGNVS